jgi:hypothetical protein
MYKPYFVGLFDNGDIEDVNGSVFEIEDQPGYGPWL